MDLINSFLHNSLTSNRFGHHNILPDILTILFFAVIVVMIFRKIKLSPLIGYIAAGAIIGPFGFNIANYNDTTKTLAEFGVVFLLFVIGLELTFERLLAMRKIIFGLGTCQFLATSLIFSIILFQFLNDISLTIIIATGLSLSSTAIVLKVLAETHQANTDTGKISLSILLLQDLAVIPLFVLIPLLAGNNINIFSTSLMIIIKSFLALSIIILSGRYLLKPILHVIAAQKYEDLFIATTLFIVLSSAWLTNYLGLSLGFGAFIAGVIIAETEFQHKVKSTISPFKSLFLAFFFITEIGMHLDLTLISDKFIIITFLAALLIIIKVIVTTLICYSFKNKFPISLNTALLISQTSEFAFVLFELARKENIMTNEMFQLASVVVGISMAVTPILAMFGRKYEDMMAYKKDNKKSNITLTSNSIIIAGYGKIGQTIANILQKEQIRYIAIDKKNKLVASYHKKNIPIFYGNVADDNFLDSLSLEESPTLILTMSNKVAIKHIIQTVKKKYPNIQLIVRALDENHYKQLNKLKAKQHIIPEVQETALQMTKIILTIMGESEDHISQTIEEYRIKEF